jgi:glycine oxidase
MKVDVIIVGQGLAGSALSWILSWRGLKLMIIDRGETVTASKIAAGLMTPFTGRRQVISDDFNEMWIKVSAFYRRTEQKTGALFFEECGMTRLFEDEEERKWFAEQRQEKYADQVEPLKNSEGFVTGYRMRPAGRLHVSQYLRATRQYFQERNQLLEVELDTSQDIRPELGGVSIPHLDIEAKTLVFCQGYQKKDNIWFSGIPNAPVRGDILRLRMPDHYQEGVIHRGVWIVPDGKGEFLAGSTYDRQNLRNVPSEAGRREIMKRLEDLVTGPTEVIDHQAAVRAGTRNRRPVSLFHKDYPSLALINGMGSRGSLQAPVVAQELSERLFEQIVEKAASAPLRVSVTLAAHTAVSSAVGEGDSVIDATAGNGHDTLFLARQVGPTGRVVAMDIQTVAIETTRKRLEAASISNVELRQTSHENISECGIKKGEVAAVMFNLGYLPGSDRSVTTQTQSTTRSIRRAAEMLRPGGVLTIIGYRGHAGGKDETEAVQRMTAGLAGTRYSVMVTPGDEADATSPMLFLVRRIS